MNYEWLDSYLLAKKGATKDYKAEWGAMRYLLHGKMFAMMGEDKTGKPIITLKSDPMYNQLVRKQYASIIPGYYMNKEHWNSVYMEGETPDEVLREMADQSYQLVLAALPKKTQKELLEGC